MAAPTKTKLKRKIDNIVDLVMEANAGKSKTELELIRRRLMLQMEAALDKVYVATMTPQQLQNNAMNSASKG